MVVTSIHLASDLKVGQYLKIPPRVMFGVQMLGTVIGEQTSVSTVTWSNSQATRRNHPLW